MMRRWLLATLASLGLALSFLPLAQGCAQSEPRAAATGSPKCDPKAKAANLDFVLQDMNGRDLNLSTLKGKVVLLNFWATWCGPCKVEIPMFVELQEKYRDQGVTFVGLSVDDPPEKLRPFANQYKINYPVLIGVGRDDVQDAFGPMWGIPVTFLISRDGRICKRQMGITSKEQLEQEIKDLL
jgi:thiol-disulfide isomerase/thioredoxin